MTLDAPPQARRRARARVEGTVQGVGFRPFVYRLATELGLGGYVLNDSRGVLLEVEGKPEAVRAFLERLVGEAPPLALLERVAVEDCAPAGEETFDIRSSPQPGVADAPVTADSATCEQCLAELFDPGDRRFRYPFINCTNCGPRFTIVRGVPYDRPLTTMSGFEMCDRCRAEYEDPLDRRFHAQPNACPQCGPAVALLDRDARAQPDTDMAGPVRAAAFALRDGAIVAVKGVGGYHLACRADDEQVVAALRARKHREDKPFALMTPSAGQAQRLVRLGRRERELLCRPERPIVLAARRPAARVADSVAPRSPELGVMLPYSPLHHLLLADFAAAAGLQTSALVMTSGNVSDEPIAYRDEDVPARLAGIADLFLVHDREIETRTDDSVVRVVEIDKKPRTAFLRRSRGYVPGSLRLRGATPRPLLACGAQLKNTFCVAKGERAWVSHHIGDLENYETLRSFREGVRHFERLFAVQPEVVVHDLHPEYLSTKFALDQDDVALLGVQHHHAHLAACLAEHEESGPAIGAIFDGTGYGTDGTVWGGELLLGGVREARRVGRLVPVRLPGGERAIREPWRMACAWLMSALGDNPELPATLAEEIQPQAWRAITALSADPGLSPLTTSMGRLFDAVAALCGLRATVNYEGQAAIELEAACDPSERGAYELTIESDADRAGGLLLDPRGALRALLADLTAGVTIGRMASRFHNGVAEATAAACAQLAGEHATELVVLSGGVFQNRRLLEASAERLRRRRLRVLVPELLPANDAGVAFGQAAVAAATLAEAGSLS